MGRALSSVLRFLGKLPSKRKVRRARQRLARALRDYHLRLVGERLECRALLTASIFTDKPDYAPGETVLITRSGFQLGETVQFQVRDNNSAVHQPWLVADGGPQDQDGVANGNISTAWTVSAGQLAGVSFTLTASGAQGDPVRTAFSVPSISTGSSTPSGPQVLTDKADYAPGETAAITGSGFQVGETVQLQVLHTDGTPNTGAGHDPWSVTDGGPGDLDGQANGNFQTTWFVHPDDSLGSTFLLTAQGNLGSQASATFTDDVTNGSFESGLGGWTTSGSVTTTTSHNTGGGIRSPIHGTFFARLAGGSANVYTTLSQTFTVNSGDRITGYAFYDATDYSPFLDDGFVKIGSTTLFSASVGTVGDFGQTPWTYWEYTFPSGGTYILQAGVRNTLDSINTPFLGLDAVTLNSIPTNLPPVANNDSVTTAEDTPVTVNVLANDTDADGNPLSAVLVAGPAHAASFAFNANGSFSYTPDPNFNGPDSFTYRASDGTLVQQRRHGGVHGERRE